jgi:beta-lactamase regulating signal transducer with metallopeptidase domain
MISLCFQWLLTYLLHSTVLIGCAALLDWRRRLTAGGVSSPLWRLALFGGFFSATLQPVLLGFFGDFQLTAEFANAQTVPDVGFAALMLPPLQADAIDIAPLLVPTWLGIAVCGLVYLSIRLVRLIRVIGRMPVLSSPDFEHRAHRLALCARIPMPQLRIGAHLQTPFLAPGRVICIPAWMLDRYESPRLHAALAHEMGHLRRHDDTWRIVSRVAAIVGWLQPLNRLAIGRLDESAELACDAWAASATGLRRELACSLEDCAIRGGPSRQDLSLAIGMAANRYILLERVKKLLEDSHMESRRLRHAAWWSSAVLSGIAVIGSFIVIRTLDDDVPPRWLATNGLYQSLQNSAENVRTSRSVIIKSPGQYVYIRLTEGFSFGDPLSARPRAGTGAAVISETRGGVTRSLRFERGTDTGLRRTYKINGRVHAFDAAGEQWLATMMTIASQEVDRS